MKPAAIANLSILIDLMIRVRMLTIMFFRGLLRTGLVLIFLLKIVE